MNAALYDARAKRKQPRLDDKVLLAWNGLMIGAMARVGLLLKEEKYIRAAAKAADFASAKMRDERGDLLRSYRASKASTPAFLEDFAFFIDGLLALHEAGAKTGWLAPSSAPRPQGARMLPRAPQVFEQAPGTASLESPARRADEPYLAQARALARRATDLFADERGGFYDTRAGQSDLFVRARSTHDGAVPSGSSVMFHDLIQLHHLTGESDYLDHAIGCVRSLSSAIAQSPVSAANATPALLRLLAPGQLVAARLAALGPAPHEPAPVTTTVEVLADTDRIQVGKDHPAELHLHLRIKDGYHLTAADPGPGGKVLIPLRIGIVHGTGIAAYADYPEGEKYGKDGELRIYKNSIEFRVAVERRGEWTGRPLLSVTYQACTDTECLAPVTVELDVAVDKAD